MKFYFENFGYVDRGTVELGDLTIVCGANNVSKTYVTYAIYGLIKDFQTYSDILIESDQLKTLKEEGILTIDLSIYQQNLSKYTKNTSEKFSNIIASYFNTSSEFFEKSKIEFSIDNIPIDLDREFKGRSLLVSRTVLILDKESGSKDLSVALPVESKSTLPDGVLTYVINDAISQCLFANVFPNPFIVTSERTGIALFYKELDISKNAILERLTDSHNSDPLAILNSRRSRYARPIHDNIDVVRDYENFSKYESFIREDKTTYKPVLDALQDLMGGTFNVIGGQMFYEPKKERGRERVAIPVYIASSAIKSLFLIDLYINCLAEKKGMLVIDEPELNLHPDNQRKMAKLLARLVNAGVKVLLTTHSDYLIREFNNCIMLSNEVENKEAIMKKAGMVTEDILRPEQVKAYSINKDHLIHDIPIDKYGMNMKIFDELISEANALSDDIYYSIKE